MTGVLCCIKFCPYLLLLTDEQQIHGPWPSFANWLITKEVNGWWGRTFIGFLLLLVDEFVYLLFHKIGDGGIKCIYHVRRIF